MNTPTRIVALAAAAALALSCGDDGPSGPGPIQDDLVFTRADQSRISFASGAMLHVWCGPWEEGVVPAASIQILFGGPTASDPRWHLRAVAADVTPGVPIEFPNSFIWDQPKDVDIFIYDPPNELSTQDYRSSGSITFQQLRCGSGGEIRFSIDAVVGSEFGDGPSVAVTGAFRAPIDPPKASGGSLPW